MKVISRDLVEYFADFIWDRLVDEYGERFSDAILCARNEGGEIQVEIEQLLADHGEDIYSDIGELVYKEIFEQNSNG